MGPPKAPKAPKLLFFRLFSGTEYFFFENHPEERLLDQAQARVPPPPPPFGGSPPIIFSISTPQPPAPYLGTCFRGGRGGLTSFPSSIVICMCFVLC